MVAYALLIRPSANRVYASSAVPLAIAEVAWINEYALAGRLSDVRAFTAGGVEYVGLQSPAPLGDEALEALRNSSAGLGLFAVQPNGDLRPLDVRCWEQFDSDLITIQRYPGKTNEQFTHLLVNVALAAAQSSSGPGHATGGRRLLDPVCGRGTTLNRGLTYGLDVAGVDTDRRHVDAYTAFLRTYFKDKRVKFDESTGTARKGQSKGARFLSLKVQRGSVRQRVDIVTDDTVKTVDHFGTSAFDLIVGDLPYGIQHGAQSEGVRTRSPLDLLRSAGPVWAKALKGTGAMALAWNARIAQRGDVESALVGAGFEVLNPPSGTSFEHRVDRTITRDVVVAKRRRA